ncbi:MAG TPA: metal-sensing transcriptional repressor [Aquabacterium sp.]|nr:metal-sensing transcriptional repressor [Aquabacterium sp.]
MKSSPTNPNTPDDCKMAALDDDKSRTDILNRLKRAEGQLRGIQRMIEEGEPCLDIATQMAAVRKALDSTYVRMTMCFMEQQLQARARSDQLSAPPVEDLMHDIESLLGKIR